ncbi:MAG: hypothetical protein LBG06_05685 [Deltaproteobacteria bacterium]|nr:hypothetical protein [Deltaproteobacteria bacterium]
MAALSSAVAVSAPGRAAEGGAEIREPFLRPEDCGDGILLSMADPDVPFTDKAAGQGLRMSKVHDKVTGTFRRMRRAGGHCRAGGCILSCRKQGYRPLKAPETPVRGEIPAFFSWWLEKGDGLA